MLVFPQLSTGAPAMYPIKKKSVQRSVVNSLGDGSTVIYADPDAANLGWELHATGLTSAEWAAIDALFIATSGMWQSFTFLDPVGNLLAESEDFGTSAWTNGALTELTTGVGDPLGTTRGTTVTNVGQATEGLTQALSVPGNFQYCLSLYARTGNGTSVTLSISTIGGSATKTFSLGTQWKRISLSANLGQGTEAVTFAALIPAGGAIDLFGMQAEAQSGYSDYKLTGAAGGVYATARFGADKIAVTAQGTDVFDAVIQIVNMEN